MNNCQRRGSGHSSLSIPLSEIDGVSHCDPDKYLEEADFFDAELGALDCTITSDEPQRENEKETLPSLDHHSGVDAEESSEVKYCTLKDPKPLIGRAISLLSRQQHNDKGQQVESLNAGEKNMIKSLEKAIAKSKQSHLDLQNWDKKMGNKMSFSRTMSNTFTTRVLVDQIMKEMSSRADSTNCSAGQSSRTCSTDLLSSETMQHDVT